MRLSLAARTYDLSSRALVMGVAQGSVGIGHQARQLVDEGADVVDLGAVGAASEAGECELVLALVAAARATVDAPLCVTTARPAVAAAVAAAGVALVDVGAGDDARLLDAPTTRGAVAIVSGGAGLDPARVLVETDDVARVAGLARCGPAVVLRLPATGSPAAMAVGVLLGAGILRTAAVRDARRVCDVLAAVGRAGA